MPAAQTQWITLKSHSPNDIIAAVRQSHLFNLNYAGAGDHPTDVSHVGTPQLVTYEAAGPGYQGNDAYVIPILDSAGATTGTAVAWLNASHTAIYVGYIRPYTTSFPTWPIALGGADQAVLVVQAHDHVALRQNAHPRLAWFSFNFPAQWHGKIHWTAGGLSPDDPMWVVPGADGRDHLVGSDGHSYTTNELPAAPLQ